MNYRYESTHLLMNYYYSYSILHSCREAGQVILLFVVVNLFYKDGNEIISQCQFIFFNAESSCCTHHLKLFFPLYCEAYI
jgi:hypothetical protein